LIEQFRTYRIQKRKIRSFKGKLENDLAKRLQNKMEKPKLTHILKERYPTFMDALQDVDDALSLCFVIATMRSSVKIHDSRIKKCEKLSKEWLAYVVKTNSLRKVFVSIKGYYYQAVVFGQSINWMIPHPFRLEKTPEVDLSLLANFSEFYEELLTHVIFKLYTDIGFHYPPRLTEEQIDDGIGIEELLDQLETKKINAPKKKSKSTKTPERK